MDNESDDKSKRQSKKCELCGVFRHNKNSDCPNKKQWKILIFLDDQQKICATF